MTNGEQDLLILLGILTSIIIAAAVIWVGSRIKSAQISKEESLEATNTVTEAALKILKGSLKEANVREESLITDVRELRTQVAYLQKTVEALARQVRDAGQVPRIPSR